MIEIIQFISVILAFSIQALQLIILIVHQSISCFINKTSENGEKDDVLPEDAEFTVTGVNDQEIFTFMKLKF